MTVRSGTGVADDLVRRYLGEIGAHPLLSAEDETELGLAIAAGRAAAAALVDESRPALPPAERAALLDIVEAGGAARRRFIQANLRLVVSIAKRYQSSGLPLLDLVQEGNLGLMRAVEKFEPTRGCKFSTYATWWIRQAISRAVADKARAIRIPVHMLDTVRQVNRATAALTDALGREPTVAEVAHRAGLPVASVLDARSLIPDPVSLQLHVGDDDTGAELGELLADRDADEPFDAAEASLRQGSVQAALARLAPREQEVIALRFGLAGEQPETLEQVGARFRLTRERIRQIEAKALAKLRHPTGPPGLRALSGHAPARRALDPQAVSWA